MNTRVLKDLTRAPQEVVALYERAFPPNERNSFESMHKRFGDACELLIFEEDGQFIGFVLLLTYLDLTHILYLAVGESLRGHGYGAQALEAIHRHHPAQRIIADLEDIEPAAPNNAEREHRMQFYRRNGYEASDVRYVWRGDAYVMFVRGGELGGEEFETFWQHFS